jgi:signal peptidase I
MTTTQELLPAVPEAPGSAADRVVVAVPPDAPTAPARSPLRPRRRRGVRLALLALLVLSAVQQACVTSYLVAGNSMLPAFHNGDRVVVARMPAGLGDPGRGDTVIAEVNGEIVIKRVMGLPGETVQIGHGQVLCGGQAVEDPVPSVFRDGQDMSPIRLGPDEYFLMGDHRRVSIDSREFGPVRRSRILGTVILRVAGDD